jgi:hypothetical protein
MVDIEDKMPIRDFGGRLWKIWVDGGELKKERWAD